MSEKNIAIQKIDGNRWMIERCGSMHTSGIVYASEAMLPKIMADQSLQQVSAVACLPGIVGSSLAMPDIHWGYGFPHRRGGGFRHGRGCGFPGRGGL